MDPEGPGKPERHDRSRPELYWWRNRPAAGEERLPGRGGKAPADAAFEPGKRLGRKPSAKESDGPPNQPLVGNAGAAFRCASTFGILNYINIFRELTEVNTGSRKFRFDGRLSRFLVCLLLCLMIVASAAAEEEFQPFFRFDLNKVNAWQEPLSNVRFLTSGAWTLNPIDPQKCEEYGIDPNALPSTEGLDTLNISGSAEFSEDQFLQLADDIRSFAQDRQVWIVDCRLESHALINGIAISWYGDHNWANKGMTLAEAEADEQSRFGALPGTTITVYTASNNTPGNPQEITVERWMSERELVEREGFHYLRLAGNDHSWPEEDAVDGFISFVRELDQEVGLDNVWLHFHCHAGKSRTGIFMAIYDMIRNPGISFEDVMLRQAMTGSSYLPNVDEQSEIADVYVLRAQRIRQVYDYLHSEEGDGMGISWIEWLSQN